MPTVPRYSAQVTPGISQARQNISASPAAFGGQEARALGQVGQGLNALAQRSEEIQAENDELQAREAYVAASDALRDRMRGEGGYLTLQGRNAYEGYDDFAEEIERLPNEYLGGMSDRARERFLEMWASRRESALNQGASHSAGQRTAYAEQIFEAERAEATLAAIEDRGDAGAFSARLSQGERAIRDRGAAMGMDGEVVDLLVDEWRSATILSSINAALDSGDTAGARAMYERSEGLMMPGQREDAQAVLRTADVTVRAQEGVDALWARFGTDAAAARREIRQNYEGELEDQMIRRYDARVAESVQSRANQEARLIEQAETMIGQGTAVDDLPPHMYEALGNTLRDYYRRREQGIPAYTDFEFYDGLLGMTPRELRSIEVPELRRRLADREFNEIMGRREREFQPTDFTTTRSFNQQIRLVGEQSGLNENQVNQLYEAVQVRVNDQERALQRPLTPEERSEVLANYTAETVFTRPGRFWGTAETTRRPARPERRPLEGVAPEHEMVVEAVFAGQTVDEATAVASYERAVEWLRSRGRPINSYTLELTMRREYSAMTAPYREPQQ